MQTNKFKYTKRIVLKLVLICIAKGLLFNAMAQLPIKGKYVARYADSTVKEVGYYTNGLKDKRWYYYTPKGVIEHKEKWEVGVMKWQLFYNKKGKVVKSVNKDGVEKIPNKCNCN